MNAAEIQAAHIAYCRICLLATAMKDCHNCLFNIGLATEVTAPVAAISVDEEVSA